uniref:Hydroxyproline-rich glycoprotein family protein n=1 Tax=Brassica campestris TaxID=3711 RepID=M4DBP4_BRACM
MRNVNNTVETVNAAASAIVSAESRVQPSSVQKKKWGSWRSLYWCFGSQKNNKRIGHAVLVPEPVGSGSAPVAPVQNSSSNSTSIFLPFIAPPSSPASFLQSGPSSVSHTPHGVVNAYSRNEPPSAFAIGPYANETQPVTPPVDSAVTTAPYTPPPESGRASCATPSSPEVPFAQLLTSSLERARRSGGGVSQKVSAGHYEFKSHQVYPGSPGGNLISPGSVVSNSGTSSPYPGKCSIIEFRVGEPPRFLGFEHFTARKWGSRFGSGTITPAGQGSRLGSGALTPDGGSGGLGSKLGSGAVTPNGVEMVGLGSLLDSQISEVASLANSDDDGSSSRHGDEGGAVAHRVSFELTGEDVARCFASKLYGVGLDEKANKWSDSVSGDELSEKLRTFSLGSSKEFKFDNTKEEKTAEWWANEKVAGKGDNSPGNSWSFFPVLRSGGFS